MPYIGSILVLGGYFFVFSIKLDFFRDETVEIKFLNRYFGVFYNKSYLLTMKNFILKIIGRARIFWFVSSRSIKLTSNQF